MPILPGLGKAEPSNHACQKSSGFMAGLTVMMKPFAVDSR
jgi:hypothetical protein